VAVDVDEEDEGEGEGAFLAVGEGIIDSPVVVHF